MQKNILTFFFTLVSFISYSQCLEITGILINACNATSIEGENEMLTFTNGNSALDINDVIADWPNNSFQGWCTSPTATAALNATITNGCGQLIEPPGGIIPANANVIVITSTNVSAIDNTFEGLTETLYIVYQCVGNTAGHFVNSNGTGIRTTTFTISGGCTQVESVTYDRQFLINTEGERVFFDAAGNATYDTEQGCTAPVTSINPFWDIPDICQSNGIIDLTTLLSAGATTGGTWMGVGVVGSDFDPSGLAIGSTSITYSVAAGGCVGGTIDSTITFDILDNPSQGTLTLQNCDSVFYGGTWYIADTSFVENNPASAPFACDSSTLITIEILDAIRDTVYVVECDSAFFDAMWYYQDTIVNDTTSGSGVALGDTILQTSFEDSEGWTDHSSGDWTQVDAYGTWTAEDMYANQFNPNTGSRNIGMNDVGDFIELPPVSNPETMYYYDRLSSAATSTNELAVQYFDGTTWQTISTDICTHTNYELVTVDLSSISSLTNVPLRIFRTQDNKSAYIDDIVVEASAGSTPSCDSILTAIITINSVVSSIEYLTTTNPSLAGTVSNTIVGGAANGCDSTHTVITTFVPNCDLDTTTIMTYNVLQYNASPTVNRDADFTMVISAAMPDILVLQEIQNQGGANRFRDNVMANVSADYAMATFVESNDMDNVLFYNQNKFSVNGVTAIPNAGPRDFHQYEMMHRASCTPFYVYSVHFKAGQNNADEMTRATQATELRTVTDALPVGTNFTIVGDFNIYGSNEDAYTNLTNTIGNGEAIDAAPILGTWNTPQYADYHTQSPRTTSFGGGAIGGLDDRFDIIFHSVAIANGTSNMYPINEDYHVFGNDGQHYNIALTDAPANGVVSPAVAQALHDASDHLPVMTNFAFCVTLDTTFVQDTICFGGTYTLPSGTVVNAAGVYNDVGLTATGCDTIIQLDLFIRDIDSTFNAYTSCNPADVGIFSVTTPNQYGCDSVHTDTVTLAPFSSGNASVSGCDSLQIGSTWYFANAVVNDTIVGGASNGCDSITTYTITINNSTTGVDVQSACDTYTWIDGNTYTTSNNTAIHTIAGGASNGCDSIVTLDLTINNSVNSVDVQSACDTYTWIDGNTYTTSNNTATHTIVGGAANGCDSIVMLDLTINNVTTGIDVQSTCGASYTWIDGNIYTTSNNTATHTIIGGSANGCDSVVTLNLTVGAVVNGVDVQSACDTYTWIDGNTYTTSNNTATHTIVGGSSNGCDSVVTLDLTIHTTPSIQLVGEDSINIGEVVELTATGNAATYTWSTGDVGATVFVSPGVTTTYSVVGSNGNCIDEDSIQIFVINEEVVLQIPTAFSPNGDGLNDLFRVVNIEDFTSLTMRIYNRWGELIFEGVDNLHAWDGVYKSKVQNIGVYTYYIDVQANNGEVLNVIGNVTLIK